VRIGNVISQIENLVSGVPQGGIISPLLYIIYVADLQIWLKHVSAITYADETSTSVSHTKLSRVIMMLEEDQTMY
jgi:retron-type reverse transcriptase